MTVWWATVLACTNDVKSKQEGGRVGGWKEGLMIAYIALFSALKQTHCART